MDQNDENNENEQVYDENVDENEILDDFEDFEDFKEPEEKPIPTLYTEVTRETREILKRYDIGDRSERSLKIICRWLLQTEQQSLYPEKRILTHLHPIDLEDVAQNIIYQEYAPKELIFLQTEIGTSYYIIFSGSVNIMLADLKNVDMSLHKEYVDQKFKIEHEGFPKLQNSPITETAKTLGSSISLAKILENLSQGKYFGELALMSKEPIRTATAIASDYTELLSIHKNYFDKYIRPHHFLSEDFEDQINYLVTVDIFNDWNISRTSSIVYWSKCCHYRNSTVIHKQGDKIEGIDFIYEGMVKLLINNPVTKKQMELSIYPRGTFYGEELLCFKNNIFEYSVIASSPVTILRLYERDFTRFSKLCKSTECLKKMNKICKGKIQFRNERLMEFTNTLPLLTMKPTSPLSSSINNNNNNKFPFSPIRIKQQQLQQNPHVYIINIYYIIAYSCFFNTKQI